METSDWIGIVQAAILLITAIIIAYYTYETYKIRKETSKQNTLLAEQILMMQQSFQHQVKRESSFIQPILRFSSGSSGAQQTELKFINKGGPAKNLKVLAKGSFHISVRPTTIIDTNEQGVFELRGTDLRSQDRYSFEIEFEDKFGEKHKQQFYYHPQTGHFSEDNGT